MLLLVVISGFALAVAAPWLSRIAGKHGGNLLAMLPAVLFAYFLGLVQPVTGAGPISEITRWVPTLGVDLSFRVDGLSLIFCLLITGVGTAVIAYTGAYLASHEQLGRLQAYLLAFMASMLGLVLSDNLLALFVFWELTAFTSYLLIGFKHHEDKSRGSALQAMLVNGLGGLCLLAGVILLSNIGGNTSIVALIGQADAIRAHPHYLAALLLVLMGAFTKSAQFPFHFWLPGAMAAPSPVSAYLHSATMVKAGVYLLARLSPVLGMTPEWVGIIAPIGALTMLIGAVMAFFLTDLKQILAYTTVSMLGALVMLVGINTQESMAAAMVLLIVHSLYKGTLFLVTGSVEHGAGTREIGELGGLRRAMPLTAAIASIAALSMAGVPPMLGFISKELWYESSLQLALGGIPLVAASVVANGLGFALAGVVAYGVFFGKPAHPDPHPHDPNFAMSAGPLLLAGLGLVAGLFPGLLIEPLTGAALTAMAFDASHYHLALWHGINPAFALSLLTFALGAALYTGRERVVANLGRLAGMGRYGPKRLYELSIQKSLAYARFQTNLLQSGYLRSYVMVVVLTSVVMVGLSVTWDKVQSIVVPALDVRLHEVLLAVVILGAALMMARIGASLAAVAALGVVGYGVALMFYLFSAPDLAMTQLSVETLSVILFVLVLRSLPEAKSLSSRSTRIRDALVAATAGGLMTLFLLIVLSEPFQSRLSGYFNENSAPLANGRNVVNVILVDYRAFDTMGEITVLAVAAIGVYALLKMRKGEGGSR
ncbi:MAG: putative monovalent cation/H+ antiporter subunit A [Bryobacterales bacterium]|nr:putative monovalent cation/H+ antiporter subunit A [Bryobacterales bacterium]